MTCPACGSTAHYGSGDMATCAACDRFIEPDTTDTNAEGDWLNANAGRTWGESVRRKVGAQRGDVWVTLGEARRARENETE